MKSYPRRQRRKARHPRVPGFLPVPLRARADGWTAERQARFLAALAVTRSVSAAARQVGMARETAYRLRSKPGAESFAAAWDAVLGRGAGKRKVTTAELRRRALAGLLQPRIYRGELTHIGQKPDNSALLRYLAQLDRADRNDFDASEWSHSFADACVCQGSPLPPRRRAPISTVRRDDEAPVLRGRR
ncbi:hypothetical protein ACWPM1_14115 [Tsuneonella sp. HG249]